MKTKCFGVYDTHMVDMKNDVLRYLEKFSRLKEREGDIAIFVLGA